MIELDSISDEEFSKLSKGEDPVASSKKIKSNDSGEKETKKNKPEKKGILAKAKEFFG